MGVCHSFIILIDLRRIEQKKEYNLKGPFKDISYFSAAMQVRLHSCRVQKDYKMRSTLYTPVKNCSSQLQCCSTQPLFHEAIICSIFMLMITTYQHFFHMITVQQMLNTLVFAFSVPTSSSGFFCSFDRN